MSSAILQVGRSDTVVKITKYVLPHTRPSFLVQTDEMKFAYTSYEPIGIFTHNC
jgi:hypothetical protein